MSCMSRQDEPTYLGVYWGDRVESPQELAVRLRRCLHDIAAISSLLDRWHRKGPRRALAQGLLAVDEGELSRQLASSGSDHAGGAPGHPVVGYRWTAWNGDDEAPVGVSMTGGAKASHRGVTNSFVLTMPSSKTAGQLYLASRALFGAVVDAWDPDWGVWTSHQLRNELDADGNRPMAGWLTYLSGDDLALGERFGTGRIVRSADDWAAVDRSDLEVLQRALDRL